MSKTKTTKTSAAHSTVRPSPAALAGIPLNAQAHFYPAWWTYIGTPKQYTPTYKVVCASPQEIDLARKVKPEIVNAEFVLAEPSMAPAVTPLRGR